MIVPDPDMVDYELDTLRVMNGENVPGWIGGAAANVCCSWLKGRGYAEGFYSISQKGRDYLAALAAQSSEAQPVGSAREPSEDGRRDMPSNPEQIL